MKQTRCFIIGILSLYGCSNPFAEKFREDVHSHEFRYCCDTTNGYPNQCLTISDLDYKDDLLKYYSDRMSGKKASFSFPLNTIGTNTKLYIMGYTEDSTLADIIYYYRKDD